MNPTKCNIWPAALKLMAVILLLTVFALSVAKGADKPGTKQSIPCPCYLCQCEQTGKCLCGNECACKDCPRYTKFSPYTEAGFDADNRLLFLRTPNGKQIEIPASAAIYVNGRKATPDEVREFTATTVGSQFFLREVSGAYRATGYELDLSGLDVVKPSQWVQSASPTFVQPAYTPQSSCPGGQCGVPSYRRGR
jgi:hypothetical protein